MQGLPMAKGEKDRGARWSAGGLEDGLMVELPVKEVPQGCVRAGPVKRAGLGGPGRGRLKGERTAVGLW